MRTVLIRTHTLDALFPSPRQVHLLKVDVEGHEVAVFQGAEQMIAERRIRDIIFEDYGPAPSTAQMHMERRGYAVFRLSRSFTRLRLSPVGEKLPTSATIMPTSVATRDPARLRERLRQRGWRCLWPRWYE